jgi:hypothetical protein
MEHMEYSEESPDWTDIDYWLPLHKKFKEDIEASRSPEQRDFIKRFQEQTESFAFVLLQKTDEFKFSRIVKKVKDPLMRAQLRTYLRLAKPRLDPEPKKDERQIFSEWWNELDPELRASLMRDYERGLAATIADGGSADVIRKYVRPKKDTD